MGFATLADRDRIHNEMPWEERDVPVTMYQFLTRAKEAHGDRPALSFQLQSGPKDPAETLSWSELHGKVIQAANLFRSLGVGENDTIAYVLPNCSETVFTLLGGAIAGIVNPINPLLEADQISAPSCARPMPRSWSRSRASRAADVAQKVAEAVDFAPNVKHVLEVDLLRYLTGLKKLIVPLIRPKNEVHHTATLRRFHQGDGQAPQADRLTFEDSSQADRVAAYFHTGGTTGMPKVAQHLYSGMIYNGWLGDRLLFDDTDVVICPLPLFHVFAVEPDPDVDDRLGRACRLPHAAGLSRRRRVRQFLEADRALASHFHDRRAHGLCRADAASGQCRCLDAEQGVFRLRAAAARALSALRGRPPAWKSSKATG